MKIIFFKNQHQCFTGRPYGANAHLGFFFYKQVAPMGLCC